MKKKTPLAKKHIEESYVKALRQRLKMTREQFAVALGVSANSVGRWERGEGISRMAQQRLEEFQAQHKEGR